MALFLRRIKMSDAQIFQIFSLMYLAVGIGILINPKFYKKIFEDFIERPSVLYIGGLGALVVGYLVVAFHNTWTKDLAVIITIVGWLALVKGILIFLRPNLMIALTRAIIKKDTFLRIEALIIIILGLFFSFLGFCPKSPV